MRVCSKSSFVFIWFLFSLSIFLSILPSLLMSTSSFLQVSPVASHANQPYPHYTDFDSVETSDRLPHISAPIQPPQTNPPTTTSTNTRAKPPPQISTRRLPAPTTLTLTPSQHRCRRSLASAGNSTGQVSDRPRTGSGQAIDPASDETSRPVSANFSAKPDSRLIRDAIRADAVVDVDTPMQIQVPACWEADC